MSIISLSDAKSYLGVGDDSHDTEIQRLIDFVENTLEEAIGRNITQAVVTESFLGDSDKEVFLKNFPVVFENYSADSWVKIDSELVGEDDFLLETDIGRIELLNGVFTQDKNIEVKYKGGFSTVPLDIIEAMYEEIKKAYTVKYESGGDANIKSKRLGELAITYGETKQNEGGVLVGSRSLFDQVVKKYKRILV